MTESNYRPVTPGRGAAPYIGGKRTLARRIISRIEALPHVTYAEPFVGMGGVFFRRRYAPAAEIINDRSRDVATFFRVLQRHYQAFLDMIRWQLASRADWERLRATDADTLTDMERAARFYYLQKLVYGGNVKLSSFGVDHGNPSGFNVLQIAEDVARIHERLAGAIIECLDFEDFIERYDRPETLFYLDPPYWGSEGDYGKALFSRADFARLAAVLGRIKGNFLLSINDTEGVREIFGAFHLEEVRLKYNIARRSSTPAAELIIANRPPPASAEVGQGNLL